MLETANAPSLADLEALLTDQDLTDLALMPLGQDGSAGSRIHVIEAAPSDASRRALLEQIESELDEHGALVLCFPLASTDRDLSAWRDALWPCLHATAWYRPRDSKVERGTASGRAIVPGTLNHAGRMLVLRRRAFAMSPSATVAKFDMNAGGWNGEPGGPGYPHFRWMRRYVATFAPIPQDSPRILDFGCGAGWVGIEAAMRSKSPTLCAFDPSPEMVKITESNARASGIDQFTGRTGFGEDPPFPAAGEAPYDLVLSSGVVSFSPELDTWLNGLTRTVAAGGTLVIGDIHRNARGMRRRRREKPVLPTREMNALLREEVRSGLEARGFVHKRSAGYQLTSPIPQAMYVNETKLKGLLTLPLLWTNQISAAIDSAFGSPFQNQFDSWVMHFDRPS
ncbi:MAG: SAM-dependent methyltransferase [Planctomycetota bacterium]|jgi:SAM-dependent methyltransferase